MASTPLSTPEPKFITGSILRHILVMSATASIGLMSIFLVDFANLFYISLLGKAELAAAIGYAGTILFFNISISIGTMIATIALVSRTLGAGDKQRAREIAGSSILFVILITLSVVLLYYPFIGASLALLGAKGETKAIAENFLKIVIPSLPLLSLGMLFSGILRAVGDAKRAMYVTLGAGFVAALLDPLFIFTLDLGVYGAAYVSFLTRITTALIGFYCVHAVHDMMTMPKAVKVFIKDVRALSKIAFPAIATNVATPVGNAFITLSIAKFGDEPVAAWAIIGRLMPVAFGFIFALSGAIGPIVGQNYGAKQFDRVRQTVITALCVTILYTLVIWLIMFFLKDIIIDGFHAKGEAAALIAFFINIVIGAFIFNGAMFVANAAFNNLGYASYSTLLNWGKATLGTVPFVWVGADIAGATGVLGGQGVGTIVFGVLSIWVALVVIRKVGHDTPQKPPSPPLWRSALSAFSSGKGASLS